MNLYIEKENKNRSEIMINASIYGSGYEFQELYYYLEKNHLYLMQFNISEEGFKGDFWKHYEINFNNGSFDLVKSISCKDRRDSAGDIIYTERESTIRDCNEDVIEPKEE